MRQVRAGRMQKRSSTEDISFANRAKSPLFVKGINMHWIGKAVLSAGVLLGAWLLMTLPPAGRSHGTAPSEDPSNKVQLVSTLLPTGVQQIVVVDTESRTMAVYHVEPAQGKIQLKSVRQLGWDLQMEHFNGQAPLPGELRQVQP